VTFALGEQFADWWTGSGWMFHRRSEDGFAAGTFPRAVDNDEE
jgi:hypothetical protein